MDEQNNQNANRDIFNIGNVQGGVTVVNQVKSSKRPRTEKILISVVKAEVANRLEHSLNDQILMNLGKENQPNQVSRFWDAEIKTGTKLNKIFPSGTSIIDVFDRDDIAGNLLILGSPGSGKTVIMLELAKSLIERADQQDDYPIPVLFNLASWSNDKQLIVDWLISELKLQYGVRVDIGRKLLENHKLLPLLDGLDELKPVRQELCVLAINKFLSSESRPISVVVASRKEEYENYESKLLLMSSVALKPLAYLQIRDYLTSVQRDDLWKAIRLYDELLNLLSVPLFLNMAVLAEEELLVEEWRQFTTEEDRIDFLLNAYICRMLIRKIKNYSHKGKQPSTNKTRIWLIWLSRRLQKESKTDFLIEELQPYFLDREKKNKYSFQYRILGLGAYIIPSIIMFFHGLSSGIKLFEGINVIISLLCGIILAILLPVALGWQWMKFYTNDIEIIEFRLAENRIWSWEKARASILSDKALLTGKLLALVSMIMFPIFQGKVIEAFGTPVLLVILHIYFEGIQSSEITIKNIPNQGILKEYNKFKNQWLEVIVFFSIFSMVFIYFIDTGSTIISRVAISLILGLFLGFILAFLCILPIFFIWVLFGGGKPCIQHFFLRYTLFKSGDIPWNYAKFLDYATERLFLQRIGGRYRFIHRMLQDHFSMMSLEKET